MDWRVLDGVYLGGSGVVVIYKLPLIIEAGGLWPEDVVLRLRACPLPDMYSPYSTYFICNY
jgi:hypothetical protein